MNDEQPKDPAKDPTKEPTKLEDIRKTIVFEAAQQRGGGVPVLKLYKMTQHQAALFHQCVKGFMNESMCDEHVAHHHVQRVVVEMLGGKAPPRHLPPFIHQMRAAFPILTDAQIRDLPRMGCPNGKVEGFVCQFVTEEKGTITIAIDFDEDQESAFNDAIDDFENREGWPRDEAWRYVCKIVQRILSGAVMLQSVEETPMCVVRLFAVFDELTWDTAQEATEDQVRRYMYRIDFQ